MALGLLPMAQQGRLGCSWCIDIRGRGVEDHFGQQQIPRLPLVTGDALPRLRYSVLSELALSGGCGARVTRAEATAARTPGQGIPFPKHCPGANFIPGGGWGLPRPSRGLGAGPIAC